MARFKISADSDGEVTIEPVGATSEGVEPSAKVKAQAERIGREAAGMAAGSEIQLHTSDDIEKERGR